MHTLNVDPPCQRVNCSDTLVVYSTKRNAGSWIEGALCIELCLLWYTHRTEHHRGYVPKPATGTTRAAPHTPMALGTPSQIGPRIVTGTTGQSELHHTTQRTKKPAAPHLRECEGARVEVVREEERAAPLELAADKCRAKADLRHQWQTCIWAWIHLCVQAPSVQTGASCVDVFSGAAPCSDDPSAPNPTDLGPGTQGTVLKPIIHSDPTRLGWLAAPA